jgi:hypothetical protein
MLGHNELRVWLTLEWVRRRCQVVPGKVAPVGGHQPGWASLVNKPTPDRPRKNVSQPVPSSSQVTCTPRISRQPSALTLIAISVRTPTTRSFSRTLSTSASAATNVYRPASSGRVRNAFTASSSSAVVTLTWYLERLVTPKDSTRHSIRRVDAASRWQVSRSRSTNSVNAVIQALTLTRPQPSARQVPGRPSLVHSQRDGLFAALGARLSMRSPLSHMPFVRGDTSVAVDGGVLRMPRHRLLPPLPIQ